MFLNIFHEIRDFHKFFKVSKKNRPVVVYSEAGNYYKYFSSLVDELLSRSDFDIYYVTSDPDDALFQTEEPRLKIFYINKLLFLFTLYIDSSILIMTMTDLDRFNIRRSVRGAHHLYIFHAIVSTHMIYRLGAFDNYDTIFCVGPHHAEEIRKMEELHKLPSKILIETGYHWLDQLYSDHQKRLGEHIPAENKKKIVLIAPSWSLGNIFETCINEIAASVLHAGYRVVIRPHSEFLKRKPEIVKNTARHFRDERDCEVQFDLVSDRYFHEADVLITDWSGIALEYAFGTERPVISIETPRKIHNKFYEKLGIEPLEVKIRNHIGRTVSLDNLDSIAEVVNDLIVNGSKYKKEIIRERSKYIFNFGKSSIIGANFIIALCKKKSL